MIIAVAMVVTLITFIGTGGTSKQLPLIPAFLWGNLGQNRHHQFFVLIINGVFFFL